MRAAQQREWRQRGVNMSGTAVLTSQMGVKLAAIQRYSAAISRRYMHYFAKRHRGSDQSEQRFYLLRLDFRFRCLGQGQTWQIANLCCHWLPRTRRWRNSACRIGTPPLDHRKLTPTRGPFWVVFKEANPPPPPVAALIKRQPGVAARVNSTAHLVM